MATARRERKSRMCFRPGRGTSKNALPTKLRFSCPECQQMTLAALIPARGGSKGIARKNMTVCGGRSLLDWTAEAALQSGVIDTSILSTDDDEIAASGRVLGLDVPF